MVDTYQLEEFEHGMAMKVMKLSEVSFTLFRSYCEPFISLNHVSLSLDI